MFRREPASCCCKKLSFERVQGRGMSPSHAQARFARGRMTGTLVGEALV